MNIIKFIKEGSIDEIIKELPNKIGKMSEYCNKEIGKGMMGSVMINAVGKTLKVKVGNITIDMPVVVKKANTDGEFNMEVINGKLYIISYKNLTCEAIILYYVSKLWYKGISPHLPFMIGWSKCEKGNTLIDTIITEKHGLDKEIFFPIEGYDPSSIFHNNPNFINGKAHFKSNIAVLGDLLWYINLQIKDDRVKLPNGIEINVIKLVDYFTISFLHTYILLYDKYGLTLLDMHPGNIFIHWINDNSYMGSHNIKKIEKIIYKIDNIYFQIDTCGCILKIGDIGASALFPRDDVYILGQAVDIKNTYKIAEYFKKPNIAYDEFFGCINRLHNFIKTKTTIWKILNDYPYSHGAKYIDEYLDPKEVLLKYFKDYVVKNPKKSKNAIII